MARRTRETVLRSELDRWLGATSIGLGLAAGAAWAVGPESGVVPAVLVGGAALALAFVFYAGLLGARLADVVRTTSRTRLVGLVLLDGFFVVVVVRAVLARDPGLVRIAAGGVLAGLLAVGIRQLARASALRRRERVAL
jgi:hypothetical protein